MYAFCPPYFWVPVISSVCEAECRHQQYLWLSRSIRYTKYQTKDTGRSYAKGEAASLISSFSSALTPLIGGTLMTLSTVLEIFLCFIWCPHL